MADHIKIFDTTLRDGEQAPGCSMNLTEKLEVAKCLERLKVDIIEAGFAISSPGDFESVKSIADTIKDCSVASLARSMEKDIDAAWNAVKGGTDPRIHVFLATSPLHMEYKLHMTPEQVLENITSAVGYAHKYLSNIEFSCEDATRSDLDFMVKAVDAAIAAGATTINLPDTVGYTTPDEMKHIIQYVMNNVKDASKATFSVHCHNDLGMAVANSLAGVLGGARQIECALNGLGERAGNTALEEVVMALRTRPDIYPDTTRLETTQLYRASKTVYNVIGQSAPFNKPIVGRNAFAHESGIHQHGVLNKRETYEILTPEAVGIVKDTNIVLGKHSGKHAFEDYLTTMGYHLSEEELARAFEEFKVVCDKKKTISNDDIEAIVSHNAIKQEESENDWKLDWFSVHTSNFTTATCTLSLIKGEEKFQDVCLGDGPLDAAFGAIAKIVNPVDFTFDQFSIDSTSEGEDSLGDVKLKFGYQGESYTGRGLTTDIIEASIIAYLKALNKMNRALEKEAANN